MGREAYTGGPDKENSRKPEGNTSGINRGEPTRKIGIEKQNGILADIQVGHLDRINASLGDKLRDVLGVGPGAPIGQTMAGLSKDVGTETTTYVVALGGIGVTDEGKEGRTVQHIHVAEEYGGVVFPKGEFTDREVTDLIGMVGELLDAKTSGLLPNLSRNCTMIDDPSQRCMRDSSRNIE